MTTLNYHTHYICTFEIDSDNNCFYSIGRDNQIIKWNLNNFEVEQRYKKFYSNICPYTFSLSPSKSKIAAINYKNKYIIDYINLEKREIIWQFDDIKQGEYLLEKISNSSKQ